MAGFPAVERRKKDEEKREEGKEWCENPMK
jgi:hypothetical protein